jgi:hypothetical protein
LAALLRVIGERDESILPIAEYFEWVRLPGVSFARVRDWPNEEITEELWTEIYGDEID